MRKKCLIFILLILFIFIFQAITVLAASTVNKEFNQGLDKTAGADGAGYPIAQQKQNPGAFFAKMLGGVLAPVFTGVMGMLVLSYGGYTWMMARGNEEQVQKAKTIIINTIIALIVLYSVFAIVVLIMPLWAFVTKTNLPP